MAANWSASCSLLHLASICHCWYQEAAGGGMMLPGMDEAIEPWQGLEPEATLPPSAFKCEDGRLIGMRLPGPRGKRGRLYGRGKFYYVRPKPMPNLDPIEVYNDIADDRRHFLLFPPTEDDIAGEWRVMMRVARSHGLLGLE
mmetsp:Transcript_56362/g.158089  ORF Transcript_56362/g.158089 Transcript_56362/m.158089 type:complete len:142 (-) Transcript_56362:79-504(-)